MRLYLYDKTGIEVRVRPNVVGSMAQYHGMVLGVNMWAHTLGNTADEAVIKLAHLIGCAVARNGGVNYDSFNFVHVRNSWKGDVASNWQHPFAIHSPGLFDGIWGRSAMPTDPIKGVEVREEHEVTRSGVWVFPTGKIRQVVCVDTHDHVGSAIGDTLDEGRMFMSFAYGYALAARRSVHTIFAHVFWRDDTTCALSVPNVEDHPLECLNVRWFSPLTLPGVSPS